ncbi:MAG: hypothetical protein AAGD96_32960 [Chloroflexota bacterium]
MKPTQSSSQLCGVKDGGHFLKREMMPNGLTMEEVKFSNKSPSWIDLPIADEFVGQAA